MKIKASGLKEYIDLLKRKEQELPTAIKKAVQETIEEDVLPIVQRNTPIQTGALRKSLRVEIDRRVEIVSDLPYAVEIHEDVSRAMKKTAQSTPEGMEGPKFISRSVNAHLEEIKEGIAERLKEWFQKGA